MTKAEQSRLMTWRFKVLQQAAERSRNVARTCRHFGLSRKTFYKWKKRYDPHGAAGLGDRASTPHVSPRATPREVVSKILYLREHYHFGPGKIADYLQRFHGVPLAPSSVHRLLVKHGMRRLPANQKHRPHRLRWQRYEKPQPSHRLQLDVKFLERIPGTKKRLYQFTAIDDCTRIRVLKVYDACNQGTAIRFLDEVLRRLPFRVQVVQTDTTAPNSNRTSTGAWRPSTSAMCTFARGHPISMARWNGPIGSTTKSSISCSTKTASPTTFTSSTRSCGSGRTTTITTGRMGRSMARRPMSASGLN
jgi:transposase